MPDESYTGITGRILSILFLHNHENTPIEQLQKLLCIKILTDLSKFYNLTPHAMKL